MKSITKFYRNIHTVPLISNLAFAILCGVGFILSGAFIEHPITIAVEAVLVIQALFSFFMFLAEPSIFKRKMAGANADLLSSFESGTSVNSQTAMFFEKGCVLVNNWIIRYADYSEIVTAQMLLRKIKITLKNGEKLSLPFTYSENPAVLCALLRSKNGEIDFIVNGQHIEKVSEKKKNKQK